MTDTNFLSKTIREIREERKQYRPVLYCSKCGKSECEVELVRHHTKYPKFHNEEETVWICFSCHSKLHRKLRIEGKCQILPEEIEEESTKCRKRREHFKYDEYLDKVTWRTKPYERFNREQRKRLKKEIQLIPSFNLLDREEK